ncbi:MAG: recombinase family protein [Prevotella sp.]|jgi:DNA invertase Pin-like site-specific DNA recombinase|nr:recombinase family protein [Prevotella sp.]
MGKVILLIRVSTDRQEYEAQTTELVQFVKSFGYGDNDIILIQDKESAIKLSEEERQGLNKMKEAIVNNDGNIDAVYCWELSRLSRQPKILYSIRDLLLEKRINLIVKEPFLKLLDDNKEPVSTSMIQFGFFITLVENEMRDKKARFDRGRKNKASQGKYVGGYIRYGYTIDSNKKFIINEDEAQIIRLVYNLYETGKYSHRTIVAELKELGYGNDIANIGKVQNILNAEEYTGVTKNKKLNISFPIIISKEQFNICRQISNGNNDKLNKSSEIYYSQLLLECSCCGKHLHPKKSVNLYGCPDRTVLNGYQMDNIIEKCVDQNYLNMSIMDSLLWYVAKEKEAITILSSTEEEINLNNLKIEDLKKKADSIYNRLDDLKKRRSRLGLSFSDGMIDEEAYSKRKQSLNEEENLINSDKLNYINEIERLEKVNANIHSNLINMNNWRDINEGKNILKNLDIIIGEQLDKIVDDKTRYNIIRKQVKNVVVKKIDDITKQLVIYYNDEKFQKESFFYEKKSKQSKPSIYRFSNKTIFDIRSRDNKDYEIKFPIVKEYKGKPQLGQYDKIKDKMKQDPEYAERKRKKGYYYTRCWKIKNDTKLTTQQKEEQINNLTSKYKEWII